MSNPPTDAASAPEPARSRTSPRAVAIALHLALAFATAVGLQASEADGPPRAGLSGAAAERVGAALPAAVQAIVADHAGAGALERLQAELAASAALAPAIGASSTHHPTPRARPARPEPP